MDIRTYLEVEFNRSRTFEVFATQTTAKLLECRVYQPMLFQFACGKETLFTLIASKRLHAFMSLYVCLKDRIEAEFLLTNVTRKPSSFIVWLQQMRLKRLSPSKTFWTVSTWEFLCSSVNTDMTLEISCSLEQFTTVRTVIRSSIVMHLSFMCTQVTGRAETFVTQWTFEWLISSVNSHVSS